jgi:hypothetical protein
VQLPVLQRLPLLLLLLLLLISSCLCRQLPPLLLSLSIGANAGSQHAAMKGETQLLLLLLMMPLLKCCLSAADAGVGNWSSPSGKSVDGLGAILMRPLHALLMMLPDAVYAASDDADALSL